MLDGRLVVHGFQRREIEQALAAPLGEPQAVSGLGAREAAGAQRIGPGLDQGIRRHIRKALSQPPDDGARRPGGDLLPGDDPHQALQPRRMTALGRQAAERVGPRERVVIRRQGVERGAKTLIGRRGRVRHGLDLSACLG